MPSTYGGFSGSYRSALTRANVAMVLLGITGLISVFTAFHDVAGFDLIRKAETGTLSPLEAAEFDEGTQALAGAYVLAFVGTAIAFLAWLSRTVDNVPPLSHSLPAVTPRWAIGWWFIPFANLVKPYQIVKDVHRRLATETQSGGSEIILVWWLVWLGGSLVGTVLARLPEPLTLDELGGWFTVSLIADAAGVVAAILAILVVRRVQAQANERALGLGSVGPVPSPSDAPAQATLPPCPRCGIPRQPGQQVCGTCGLDLWADFDRAQSPH